MGKCQIALEPKPDCIVLFREAGIIQEEEGLVWPSNLEDEEAGIGAPDWTRTSTPSRAQALNLLRIPIPPQGLHLLLYSLPDDLSTYKTPRGCVPDLQDQVFLGNDQYVWA
jgi:hypothetical protein